MPKLAPATENVLAVYQDTSEWPPVTRNYLSRGGTVEAAFLTSVDGAMDQDARIGDGEFEAIMGQDVSVLPTCRNDIEWDCVCDVLGYEAARDSVQDCTRIGQILGRMSGM
jgi:hypothetical protein